MSDSLFAKPRVLLSKDNFLQWHGDWLMCFSSYGLAGEEIIKDRPTIDFLHKPIVGETLWRIEDQDGQLVWIEVPMSVDQKRQVPE